MNDNRNHIGSQWGAGTPRTMDEAFPPRAGEDTEITVPRLIGDVLMLVGLVSFLGTCAVIGAAVFY